MLCDSIQNHTSVQPEMHLQALDDTFQMEKIWQHSRTSEMNQTN